MITGTPTFQRRRSRSLSASRIPSSAAYPIGMRASAGMRHSDADVDIPNCSKILAEYAARSCWWILIACRSTDALLVI